jgi:DNA invertase Pin-like site-specific DNA recombinase
VKKFLKKISGKRDDRPELILLLDQLREGDILVVYKLDRLGRSTFKLLELTAEFEKKGIEFVSIVDGVDTTTPLGKFFFRTMASIAELERDIIAERTRAGLQAARARGRNGGRPPVDKKRFPLRWTFIVLEISLYLKLKNKREYQERLYTDISRRDSGRKCRFILPSVN